jgi:uncharacterized protein (DUF362 family)
VKTNFFTKFFLLGLLGLCGAQAQTQPAAMTASGSSRVVTVEDPGVIVAYEPQVDRVRSMLNCGITKLCGTPNASRAWTSLIATNDIVGIKVVSTPGPSAGTRPAVVQAVIEELINAGLPSTNIVIWDRLFSDLRKSGYDTLAKRLNTRVAGAVETGFDASVYYDDPVQGTLIWGDLDFDRKDAKTGRKSYVSKLLTHDLTKIIVISPLLNHNTAGVNGCLTSLALGSVDNTMRFEINPERLAKAVPEIYAMRAVGDRVVLSIMDALIAQYEGGQVSLLHYSAELKQIWISKDPVALDVLGLAELTRQREVHDMPPPPSNKALYETAALLELGFSDPKRIRVEMVQP